MDQYQRGPPRQRGGGNGAEGSVRNARERMEVGLPPDYSALPSRQQQTPPEANARAFREPRAAPSPPRNESSRTRVPMPAALQSARGPSAGAASATSRPIAKSPQWPLNAENVALRQQQPRTNQQSSQNGSRNIAPQRAAGPNNPPPLFDQSGGQNASYQYASNNNRQQNSQPLRQPPRRQDDTVASPSSTASPITPVSRVSTISSVGTIPDFPLPIQNPASNAPPRRSANLGPPPTSRRGASSYYSNVSYVSPIPEESDRSRSHGSYASSNAIPSSWGDDSPRFPYYDNEEPHLVNDVIEEGRESRESNVDDSEEKGLVRSASIGKRGKPCLITTRSAEKTDQAGKATSKTNEQIAAAIAAASSLGPVRPQPAILQPTGQRDTVWPILPGENMNSPLQGGTGLIDASVSSEETVPTIARAVTTNGAATSSQSPNAQISSGPPGSGIVRTDSRERGFSRLSAIRRPPRLNIDAVREAEARGSLTSLPDLIRRATRLAAMMDNGKRPASRLDDLMGFPGDEQLGKGKKGLNEKHASGISGMLAAFPSPANVNSSTTGTPIRPQSSWPSPYQNSGSEGPLAHNGERPPKKGRRCCGLPMWGFLLLILVLLCVIAAAIVVPLELLVFNKKTDAAVSQLATCQASTTCANGGTVTVSSGACACICTNGFTGPTCSTAGSDSCTTMNLNSTTGSLSNVTVGTAIPRLISQAQTNFSIPLSAENILARFSSANASCSTENTLVTFDGFSSREGDAQAEVTSTGTSSSATASVTAAKVRRDETDAAASSTGTSGIPAPSTSLSVNPTILYDTRSLPTPASSNDVAGTATTGSAGAASTEAGSFTVTQEALDFARVVTLYVLQEQGFDAAISAQDRMQSFFGGSRVDLTAAKAGNIIIGGINTVDFEDLSVNIGNGSIGGAANNMGGKRRRRSKEKRKRDCEGLLF